MGDDGMENDFECDCVAEQTCLPFEEECYLDMDTTSCVNQILNETDEERVENNGGDKNDVNGKNEADLGNDQHGIKVENNE